MLQGETQKMEEKLELVKRMMELDKEKRSIQIANNSGTMWRGATTKTGIKGYSDQIVTNHKKNQPILPPTNVVTRTEAPKAKPAVKKAAPIKSGEQTMESVSFVGNLAAKPQSF